jgi:succinate-semialdehyde dehydrogenase/glutarate-semialdehyde dehydrogenase
MGIATVNPATGETLKTFTPLTQAEIEEKLVLAEAAFTQYQHTSWAERATYLNRTAELLEARREDLGKLMTLEMGKPLKSAIGEVEKCAWVCRFYAENAASFLADEVSQTDASRSFVRCQPLGTILAVMPWNFPLWQVYRFAAPALMAGNVGVLKHASNVPQCALAIDALFREAGLPTGVFQTLLIGARQVADVVADPRIKAATLTGSELAGASLAAAAGTHLKKVVLELGGSDPFIVMPSADLDSAVTTAVMARMLNNGQSCIAAKRFILAAPIAAEFTQRLVEKFAQLRVGDPMLLDTDIGPLATPAILQDLHRQVEAAIGQGAKVLIGGKPLEGVGNFYPPTILSELPPDNAVAMEEFFGPVALLFTVPDLDRALAVANQTPFGLGASAWTSDPAEQERCINGLEAGAVFINGMVKSDPRLPFGGIKRSGFGRELGRPGIQEFVNLKTVWIK